MDGSQRKPSEDEQDGDIDPMDQADGSNAQVPFGMHYTSASEWPWGGDDLLDSYSGSLTSEEL